MTLIIYLSRARLGNWSGVSPENCKVMHLGKQFSPKDYFIAVKNLGVTKCERYLGVLVSFDGT